MPIINIHPLASESEAEALRLTLKDADKFGLYCCHDGTSAMWSVIPKIALQLIFNAETALPVTERTWVGLTDEDCDEVERWVEFKEEGSGRIPIQKLIRYIDAKLKEKNNG
jgi:hypothetical protein